jgi:predicted transcriptional regulator
MKTLSLKLDDSIYEDMEKLLSEVRQPRNRYINNAVMFYSKMQWRTILAKKLKAESKLVHEESMNVLAEFESLLDED